MDDSDRQLVDELRDGLLQAGYQTAFDDDAKASDGAAHEGAALEGGNPLEDDFFVALNAFRAARSRGDREEIARAEERLREVVRGELTGEC